LKILTLLRKLKVIAGDSTALKKKKKIGSHPSYLLNDRNDSFRKLRYCNNPGIGLLDSFIIIQAKETIGEKERG